MESRGIGISKGSELAVKARLREETDEKVSSLLERLSSGDLTFQPLTFEPQGPYVSFKTLFFEGNLKTIPLVIVMIFFAF